MIRGIEEEIYCIRGLILEKFLLSRSQSVSSKFLLPLITSNHLTRLPLPNRPHTTMNQHGRPDLTSGYFLQ